MLGKTLCSLPILQLPMHISLRLHILRVGNGASTISDGHGHMERLEQQCLKIFGTLIRMERAILCRDRAQQRDGHLVAQTAMAIDVAQKNHNP